MKHGTYRNKIVALKKKGEVELDFRSGLSFYTLKGHKFGKSVTDNRMVVHNDPFYKMLQNLPLGKQSIHDIRLRFKVADIWKLFSLNPDYHINEKSKDISIPTWNKNNALVRTTIHKTDTVSVIIGCSLEPIPLDVNGIIRFFNLLVRVEENLQNILNSYVPIKSRGTSSIPEYRTWITTMWHFGRDALAEFNGEKFCITLKMAQHILIRLYAKDFNGKSRIRIERQEYPNTKLVDTLNSILDNLS
jgi:hypothetical protein